MEEPIASRELKTLLQDDDRALNCHVHGSAVGMVGWYTLLQKVTTCYRPAGTVPATIRGEVGEVPKPAVVAYLLLRSRKLWTSPQNFLISTIYPVDKPVEDVWIRLKVPKKR